MKKRCGGCQHFTKMKNIDCVGGVCQFHDSLCASDSSCDQWKAIPYERDSSQMQVEDIKWGF